ncbi:hypothetical protein IFR05_012210 [Cadophora sp. M221]|nr:hypothetical protein IFR05_012210 [Cadophora sp. M221]
MNFFPGSLPDIRRCLPKIQDAHSQTICPPPPSTPSPSDFMESAFWEQFNSLNLIHLNRDLKNLLATSEFTRSPFSPAAHYVTDILIPSISCSAYTSTFHAPLPPAELMQPIQQLLHLYGHPLSDANSILLQDSLVRPSASCGLSRSYMELMRDTEPEDIPIKWGLGDQALFAGSMFADDDGEVDVLEPGKTYPDWSFQSRNLRLYHEIDTDD